MQHESFVHCHAVCVCVCVWLEMFAQTSKNLEFTSGNYANRDPSLTIPWWFTLSLLMTSEGAVFIWAWCVCVCVCVCMHACMHVCLCEKKVDGQSSSITNKYKVLCEKLDPADCATHWSYSYYPVCVCVWSGVWGLIMLSESIRNNRALLNTDTQ